MISTLMSDSLAPSNGPKPHEPPREASRDSKDDKFSSFIESNDDAPQAAKEPVEDDASTMGAGPTDADTPASSQTQRDADGLGTAKLDAAATATVETDLAVAEAGTEQSRKEGLVVADETATPAPTLEDVDAKTAATAEADIDPRTASTKEDAPLARLSNEVAADTVTERGQTHTETGEADDAVIRFADSFGQSSQDRQQRQTSSTQQADAAIDSRLVSDAEQSARPTLSTGDLAEAEAHKQVAQASGDKSFLTNVARDGAAFTPETLISVVPTTNTSTPAPVATGLTPTAPTHVIAAPNELTSVIVNAVKNGGDVQEKMVVQLDPPELGRVLIDFKFDANGLQQITVTSENPEALKRLRELHFELTEALRDQGLPDSNLSFQQQAGDQSQQNWQAPEWGRAQSQVLAAEERAAHNAAMPTQPNSMARDRLDLLL